MMSCFKLSKWLIQEIDKRRRAFFSKGQKNTSGANCMIAWENVCTPKHEGGLGVKNLEQQNTSLLLKFIPTKKRIGDKINKTILVWRQLMHLIDPYRAMTIVTVGKGNNTAFWLDSWFNKKPLSCQYPHLFSHVVNKNVTVLDCRTDLGWQICTRPLTSQRA